MYLWVMQGRLFEHSVDELRRVDRFVVDTSSIIIMTDAGFIDRAMDAKRFFVPPGVLKELGAMNAERYSGLRTMESDSGLYEGFTVDAQVVVAARQLRLPVVSDDLTLLGRAIEQGIAGYTARILLELLLLGGHVSLEEYAEFKLALSGLIRYAVPLYLAAEELHWEIRKEIG
jgi:hypothetical protein